MKDHSGSGSTSAAWAEAAAKLGQLHPWIRALEGINEASLVDTIRKAIRDHRGVDRYRDLELLMLLSPSWTEFLVEDLVAIATLEQHALQVRTLLSRLRWTDKERLVPPAVLEQLPESDFFSALNYAGLLKDLGLSEALRAALRFTSTSVDEEIRLIGPEWFPGDVE